MRPASVGRDRRVRYLNPQAASGWGSGSSSRSSSGGGQVEAASGGEGGGASLRLTLRRAADD
ncbi:MAG TPA: hypothetical protein VF121_16565 [Thermoanaerobaculia bacterium]|nr:hypothetical protein [Thermoanaerobaculia bacterium]